MRSRTLFWQIYTGFLVIALAGIALVSVYAIRSLRQFHQEQVADDLLARDRILAQALAQRPLQPDSGEADRFCKEFGPLTAMRITVILPDGRVIGDSDENPAVMENHAQRVEIDAALRGKVGQSVRYSGTLRRRLMYVAVPVRRAGEIVAVVRVSRPLAETLLAIRAVNRHVLWGAASLAALFAVLAFYFSRRISGPLEHMRQVAEQLGRGNLGVRVAAPEGAEAGALARTLNEMAHQLGERIDAVTRQRREQEAIFDSMAEGVLAVDLAERIFRLNAAGARLLDLDLKTALGLSIQEAVRNPDLQKFIQRALRSDEPVEEEIVLHGVEERFMQLHGTALRDAAGERLGVVVVLNDITRLKRLERVRSDFVANVSHELKTPITAIAGCVETLENDAGCRPEDIARFVAMTRRHADRLGSIVEDLLALSRIESDAEHGRIALEEGPVCGVLGRAVETFTARAERKRIALVLECGQDLVAPINAALLEQAVGNLVDNAIKYSDEGARVRISGVLAGNEVQIRVADQGCGIDRKHLSRIFERFYRVDQARSRALGGTGLGLAIVKHIALAHRGSVDVVSTPGEGSVFTLRIPRHAAVSA